MSRLNKWLKAKILAWLGLSSAAAQIKQLQIGEQQLLAFIEAMGQNILKQIKQAEGRINAVNGRVDGVYDNVNNKLMEFEHTLKATVNVGVDFNPERSMMPDRSWAVVCIQGKTQDIVQFYSLNENEGREIHNFLKQFSKGNKVQDLPWGMKKFKFY